MYLIASSNILSLLILLFPFYYIISRKVIFLNEIMLCDCGSDKVRHLCCGYLDTGIFLESMTCPNEKREFLAKVEVCLMFEMRPRGLLEFYGDDLVAYKQEKPKSASRNFFLQVLSTYFTDYLYDICPSSWEECQDSFWKELLVAFYPLEIQLTTNEKEVDQFLNELKKFVKWLDHRKECSFSKMVNHYIAEYKTDLKYCEFLLNRLYNHVNPEILEEHSQVLFPTTNLLDDIHEYNQSKKVIFEIINIYDGIIMASDVETKQVFYITGLPHEVLTPDILISGLIAKKYEDPIWNWISPDSVYPLDAQKYLENIHLYNNSGFLY